MTYQLTQNDCIIRTDDGAIIPADGGNRDYQEYLAWLADGNVPEEPSLAEVKATRWAAVRAARDMAISGGCDTALGRVDTTEVSQLRISGAVQMAMIAAAVAQPFSIDWTMEDNSVATHDGPAMIALGVAVGQHVADCFATGVALRDAINAAETAEAVSTIAWPQG